jgi:hypothetical protein
MNLPSPPVTPYIGNKKRKASAASLDQPAISRDPVLFPRADDDDAESAVVADTSAPPSASPQTTIPADQPLFPSSDFTDELIEQHIAKRAKRVSKRQPTPTREEYKLMAVCVSIVLAQYNRNPGAYAKREREILDHQSSRMKQYAFSNLKRLAPAPAKRGQAAGNAPRPQRPQRAKRTPKSTPRQAALDSFDSSGSPAPRATPKPARVIGTNRDDTNYNSLPDYSPPVETLRGNSKALKADWKGQMLDLSNDPDRDMLDPAELHLAATLRLSCATYLCSKRRIFEARLHALRIGKEFRKTDAQQACKIDVNKASKLWTAYDRVGWFKPEYFTKFL